MLRCKILFCFCINLWCSLSSFCCSVFAPHFPEFTFESNSTVLDFLSEGCLCFCRCHYFCCPFSHAGYYCSCLLHSIFFSLFQALGCCCQKHTNIVFPGKTTTLQRYWAFGCIIIAVISIFFIVIKKSSHFCRCFVLTTARNSKIFNL